LFAALAAIIALQTAATYRYRRGGCAAGTPKTMSGPVVGALLLARLLVGDRAVADALEVATLVVAANGLSYYARPLMPARRVLPRLSGSHPSAVARNYHAKLTREHPVTDRVLTVPNMVTLMRIGPAVIGVVALGQRLV